MVYERLPPTTRHYTLVDLMSEAILPPSRAILVKSLAVCLLAVSKLINHEVTPILPRDLNLWTLAHGTVGFTLMRSLLDDLDDLDDPPCALYPHGPWRDLFHLKTSGVYKAEHLDDVGEQE
jgi:hypothetical protein